jgi:Uma2 family endonuclease
MATDIAPNDPLLSLPPELHPKVDHLVTEDDTPVDNVFSEKQQRLLTEPLFSSWSSAGHRRSFVAMANVGLFYAVRQPPFVPDVLLSLGVELPQDIHVKAHRSYFVWEYGQAPDVVIEVVSNLEGGEDTEMLAGYARVGVRYYVVFDPDRLLGEEVLRAYRLEGPRFQRMDEPVWFPHVELGLRLWQGRYEDLDAEWLRWVDAEGRWIHTGSERAEAERQRADAERQRADAERQRADAERQRAERLAEQLRRLGVAPRES